MFRRTIAHVCSLLLLSLAFAGAVVTSAGANTNIDNNDAAMSLSKARRMMQSNDLRNAEIVLRNAARDAPQNGLIRLELAKVYLQLGDPNAAQAEVFAARQRGVREDQFAPVLAEVLYRSGDVGGVLKLVPAGNRDAHAESIVRTFRGLAQLSLDDYDQALISLTDAEARDKNAIAPKVAMARLYLTKQQMALAEKEAAAALALAPRDSVALATVGVVMAAKGDTAGALVKLNAAVAAKPNNTQALIDRANVSLMRGDLDGAARDVAAAKGLSPSNLVANFMDALIKARRGQFQAADAVLDRIRGNMDSLPDSYFLAGAVKYQLAQYEQAAGFLRRYIAQRPDQTSAYRLLGVIALKQNDTAGAADILQQAYKLAPDDPDAAGLLAQVYMARGQVHEAVALLDKALKARPNDERIRAERAIDGFGIGQTDAGVSELRAIFKDGKGNVLAGPPLVLSSLRAGKLDDALATAQQLVGREPQNVLFQELLGTVQMTRKNYAAAEPIFRGVLKKAPDLIAARRNLSEILVSSHRSGEAKKLFQSRLAQKPDDLESVQALCDLYLADHDYNGAIATLQAVQKAVPANPGPSLEVVAIYSWQKKWPEAVTQARAAVARWRDSEAARDSLGRALLASGDTKGAVAAYRDAILSLPGSALLFAHYSEALENAKDLPAATDAASRACALAPKDTGLQQRLVALVLQANGAGAALAKAKTLAGGDGNNSSAMLLTANVLAKAGNTKDAIAILEKVQAQKPSAGVLLRLVSLYQSAGNIGPAITGVERWTKSHANDFVMQIVLAQLYGSSGKYDLALAQFQRLEPKRPNDPTILNNLAWLYSRVNDPRALNLALRAHQIAPDSAPTSDTLGWIYVNRGQAAQGVTLLQEAAAKMPGDADVQYHYAAALAQTKREDDARLILNKLLQSNRAFDGRPAAMRLLASLVPKGK